MFIQLCAIGVVAATSHAVGFTHGAHVAKAKGRVDLGLVRSRSFSVLGGDLMMTITSV